MGKITIQTCSDLDYEEMVVDIWDEDGRIATFSCDHGIQKTKIVLFNKENDKPIRELDFMLFLNALKNSFDKLKEANSIE